MSYLSAASFVRGLLLMIVTAVLIMYICCLIKLADQGRRGAVLIITISASAISFVLFETMTMIQQGDWNPAFYLPLEALIPVLFLLAALAVFLYLDLVRWQRNHITPMSYKEAFDRLPAGLLFYTKTGVPVMVNDEMQHISSVLFGQSITDAAVFGNRLREMNSGQTGDDPMIIKAPEGTVYSFRAGRDLPSGLHSLMAYDISREYELTEELSSGRDRARILNNRLKALLGTIEYVTMNREMLALKSALHDNIGQSILMAKRYLYAPESVDKKRMLDFWHDNMAHLINDEPEEWELPYYVISREAEALGIRLNIVGELPDDRKLIPIVDAAISVHIGNTLKHADGTEVTVESVKRDGICTLTFTNNGREPKGDITEKGGLLNLRRMVEEAGGRMQTIASPAFMLKLVLPLREEK